MTTSKSFVATLRDLFCAEREIRKSLMKMAEAARDPRLRSCFLVHLGETEGQVSRLRYIFAGLGIRPGGRVCHIAAGLISDCEQVVTATYRHPAIKDAALASRGQSLGHYEMARYRALIAWADDDQAEAIVDLLEIAIDEERNAVRIFAAIEEFAGGRQTV